MFTHLRLALMVASSIIVMAVPTAAQLTSGPIDTSPPSGFEENKGQISDQFGRARPDVRFSFVQTGFRMRLLRNGVGYELTQSAPVVDGDVHRPFGVDGDVHRPFKTRVEVQRVDVGFAGAAAMPRIETGEVFDGYTNYYYAHLPEQGATFVRSFASVTYRDLYEGVDMVVHTRSSLDGSAWPVSTDFVVRAGADPAQIRIRYEGARDVRVTAAGELEITTDLGTIREQAPVCRAQLPTGGYVNVGGRFRLDEGEVSFALDAYPTGAVLTIDPGLVWATYYGGTGDDVFNDVGSDLSGAIYAAGTTASTASIATTGAHKTTINGTSDAMLVKLRANGTRIWATYAGGTVGDEGTAVAVAANGIVFLAGSTYSGGGIATTGAFQIAHSGFQDGFVMRFDSTGTRTWGTYYGGAQLDVIADVCLLGSTGVYICGRTESTSGIASTGAHQTAYGGSTDAFVARLSWDGTTRSWGTYYGGSGIDQARAVAADANGYAIIVGATTSTSGIASSGAHSAAHRGNGDGFIAKFFSTGTRGWGTYYGGQLNDGFIDVAVDASNNIYAVGSTLSTSEIATTPSYQTWHPGLGEIGMLVRMSPTCVLSFGTYYGVVRTLVTGVAVSGSTVYICGMSNGQTHVSSADALQRTLAGDYDGFVASFTNFGDINWGTYYGGTEEDYLLRLALIAGGSSAGDIIACGRTASDGLSHGTVHQATRSGGVDALVASLRNVSINVASIPSTTLCKGTALSVPYTASGTFASTNIFRAELSDNTGSFATTSNIGLRMSPGSGTINGVVPSLPPSTGGYKIRVASSNPRAFSGPLPSTYSLFPSDTAYNEWRGTVSWSWNDPANWSSPCSVPGVGDTAVFNSGATRGASTSGPVEIAALTMNKAVDLTLGGDMRISQALQLRTGIIVLGNYNLTLDPGVYPTKHNDTALVLTNGSGEMRATGVLGSGIYSLRFPIAPSTTAPTEVIIQNAGAPERIGVRAVGGVTSNGQPTGGAITSHVVGHMWHITTASATSITGTLGLHWKGTSEFPPFDRYACFIGRAQGSGWVPLTGPDTVSSFTLLQLWYHGTFQPGAYSIGDIFSPIPVELVLFTARADGADVVLAWETADERANAGFEVQRARVDDDAWTVVSFVAARAAEGSGAKYETVDRSVAAGTWRYRLRQVDLDGRAEVTRTVTVVVGDAGAVPLVAVHPNPARDVAQVVVRDARVVIVRDVLGREVWRHATEGAGVQTLVVPTQFMPAGVYVVETDLARTLLRIVR